MGNLGFGQCEKCVVHGLLPKWGGGGGEDPKFCGISIQVNILPSISSSSCIAAQYIRF